MAVTVETLLISLAIGLGIYGVHLCVILVHEAGHALAAQLFGFDFGRISVGPFRFDRKGGFAIRFRWSDFLGGSVVAQFHSIPHAGAEVRAFGMFCAGPIFSLLFAVLARVVSPSHGLQSELAGLAMIDSGAIGILTLIPARKGNRLSDGYKMYSLIFSAERRRRLMFFLSIRARVDELKLLCQGDNSSDLLRVTNELIRRTEEIPELRSETKWMDMLLKIRARAIEGSSDHTDSMDVAIGSS